MKKSLLLFLMILTYQAAISQEIDDNEARIKRIQLDYERMKSPNGEIFLNELYKNRDKIEKKARLTTGVTGINWEHKGPNNVGGRTRAIMFDPNDSTHKKVWAGGVSGGLWYNNDITDSLSQWHSVDNYWSSLAISCISYDPSNPQIFYVGTGEELAALWGVPGNGIWKTTDGGTTWNQLNATSTIDAFSYVVKIVVNNNGEVFAATSGGSSGTSGGIYKSSNGGTTWSRVLYPPTLSPPPNTASASDLEIGTDGIIYAAFGGYFKNGSRLYKTADNGTNWTEITADPDGTRTEISLAPSTSGVGQTMYAISTNTSLSGFKYMKKSVNGGSSWFDITIPDLEGYAAWYDLALTVHPTNPNVVFAGAVRLSRTFDGGATWNTIPWIDLGKVHADQHIFSFRPTHPDELLIGNDGGIYYTKDFTLSTTVSPNYKIRNNGYYVTQFYSVAMKNIATDKYLIGGTQDNGTWKISPTYTQGQKIGHGDGMLCFIDQDQPNIQIYSYPIGYYFTYDEQTNMSWELVKYGSDFLNPADYDSQNNLLYMWKGSDYSTNKTQFLKVKVTGTGMPPIIDTINISNYNTVSFVKTGKTANTLFFGTGGKLYKITNAGLQNQTVQLILTSTTWLGWLSSVDIGVDDNEILVTHSSFNVNSVKYTNDGGTNWINKDDLVHGLPNMPVWYGIFNPKNRKQVLLATQLGVWATDDITASNPGWQSTNQNLANVICYMLKVREADNMVAVATNGRGIYTARIPNPDCPEIININGFVA